MASQDYWDALERLKNNRPKRIKKGSKINNDTVALEAGRIRGSVKKSRKGFAELIAAIEKAAERQNGLTRRLESRAEKNAVAAQSYKDLYLRELNDKLMMWNKIRNLEKRLRDAGISDF